MTYGEMEEDDIEFIEMNYNDPTPFNRIERDEPVYIVDFSIPPKDMKKLLSSITENVVWIDHHQSAIEKYNEHKFEICGREYDQSIIKGIREEGKAGCELAWEYFKQEYPEDPLGPMPYVVSLIGDWDTWRHKIVDSKAFHFGAAINCPDDISHYWEASGRYAQLATTTAIIRGQCVLDYIKDWSATYCKSFGHEVYVDGLKCFALNVSLINSDYFASMDDKGYDAYIAYAFNGKQWKVSMYSATKDISHICKRYGGGGHPGAAGFWSDTLPDFITTQNNSKED